MILETQQEVQHDLTKPEMSEDVQQSVQQCDREHNKEYRRVEHEVDVQQCVQYRNECEAKYSSNVCSDV